MQPGCSQVEEDGAGLGRDRLGQMPELNRQLRRDLGVAEFVEELQHGAVPAGIDEHRAAA